MHLELLTLAKIKRFAVFRPKIFKANSQSFLAGEGGGGEVRGGGEGVGD